MCGIIFTNIKSIKKNIFQKSTMEMIHRGPDNQSYLEINKFKFGHTRLSIQDLDTRSNQPMRINDYVIIFNGEIYNFNTLAKDHNLKVKTKSDTEVLLLMYIKYGSKCLKYFNGMFAFIIFNTKNEEFFVARDRLGIKPLYFYRNKNNFIFCSEIKPIKNLIKTSIDNFSIRQYKKFRMFLDNNTIYKEIKFFPQGYYFYKNKFTKYWDLDFDNKKNPNDAKLKFLINDAVKLRTISDVPMGTFISGGIDSTIISAIAKPNYLWSVGFKNFNEFKWCKIANQTIKSKINNIVVDPAKFKILTKQMIEKRSEPLCVPNEVLINILSKEAKNKNTVLLSGEGADEVFWGYDRIFRWAYSKNNNFSIKEFEELYCYGRNKDNDIMDYAYSLMEGKNTLEKVSYFFLKYHLHGLLRRLDNSTMLNSIEARVPFCDHRIVDYIHNASFKWKMGKGVKEPLKRIFRNKIPIEIINRKKVGFPVDMSQIFKSNNKKSFYDQWMEFNLKNFI
jgi:asparagine synthase (glutamine-hydrolysing)